MPTTTKSASPRRRERSVEDVHRREPDDLARRVSRVREDVFELVGELQRAERKAPGAEFDGAGDQMQTIANQLGAVEAALASVGR